MENMQLIITEKHLGGTLYIVESKASDTAKETAFSKVKRLIMNNLSEVTKLSDTLHKSA